MCDYRAREISRGMLVVMEGILSSKDGGLLSNNPCAIAVHEARMLWGKKVPIQCVISLGTGIYRRPIRPTKVGGVTTSTSLREKLTKVIASATDTEGAGGMGGVVGWEGLEGGGMGGVGGWWVGGMGGTGVVGRWWDGRGWKVMGWEGWWGWHVASSGWGAQPQSVPYNFMMDSPIFFFKCAKIFL